MSNVLFAIVEDQQLVEFIELVAKFDCPYDSASSLYEYHTFTPTECNTIASTNTATIHGPPGNFPPAQSVHVLVSV